MANTTKEKLKSINHVHIFCFAGLLFFGGCKVSHDSMMQNWSRERMNFEVSIFVDSIREIHQQVLVFDERCSGCIKGTYEVSYVFWPSDSKFKTMVKKFDPVKDYQELSLNDSLLKYFEFEHGSSNPVLNAIQIEPGAASFHHGVVEVKYYSKSECVFWEYDSSPGFLGSESTKMIRSVLFRFERDPNIWVP